MLNASRWIRWGALVAILSLCVGCDQFTKEIARQQLDGHPPRSFLADTVRLVYAENPGAFLGLGSQLPPSVRWMLLVVVNALVAACIGALLLWHSKMPAVRAMACAAVGRGHWQPDRPRAVRRAGDRLHERRGGTRADRHLQRGRHGHHVRGGAVDLAAPSALKARGFTGRRWLTPQACGSLPLRVRECKPHRRRLRCDIRRRGTSAHPLQPSEARRCPHRS